MDGETGQKKWKTMVTPMERTKANEGAMRQNMDLFLSVSKRGECHAHVPAQLLLTQHVLLQNENEVEGVEKQGRGERLVKERPTIRKIPAGNNWLC